MDRAPQAHDDRAVALACELAGLAATVDVARVRLQVAIAEKADWTTRLDRRDLLAAMNASAELETALIHIVASESLELAARADHLADLARRGTASEMDDSHDPGAEPRGQVLPFRELHRSPRHRTIGSSRGRQ